MQSIRLYISIILQSVTTAGKEDLNQVFGRGNAANISRVHGQTYHRYIGKYSFYQGMTIQIVYTVLRSPFRASINDYALIFVIRNSTNSIHCFLNYTSTQRDLVFCFIFSLFCTFRDVLRTKSNVCDGSFFPKIVNS